MDDYWSISPCSDILCDCTINNMLKEMRGLQVARLHKWWNGENEYNSISAETQINGRPRLVKFQLDDQILLNGSQIEIYSSLQVSTANRVSRMALNSTFSFFKMSDRLFINYSVKTGTFPFVINRNLSFFFPYIL